MRARYFLCNHLNLQGVVAVVKDASFNEGFELGAGCSFAILLHHLWLASFPYAFALRDLVEPIARFTGERLKGTTAGRDSGWRGIRTFTLISFFFLV